MTMTETRKPKIGEWVYSWEHGKLVPYKIEAFRKDGSRYDNPNWARGTGPGKKGGQKAFEIVRLTWDPTLSGWRHR